MQRVRRRLSAAGWRGVLGDFAHSGLSVEGYCEGEGLCRSSFYRWRRLLGGAQAPVSPLKERAANAGTDFIDLGPVAVSRPSTGLELRVELGGGVVLHLTRR